MAATRRACPPSLATAAALNVVIENKLSLTQSLIRRRSWRTWVTSRRRHVEAITSGR